MDTFMVEETMNGVYFKIEICVLAFCRTKRSISYVYKNE